MLIQYFIIVLIGYLIDFSIYAFLIGIKFNIYLANLCGFCLGSITNVILIRSFVFKNPIYTLWKDLIYSLTTNSLMLFLGFVFLYLCISSFEINPYISKIISNGLTFFLNYFIRKIYFHKDINVL